VWFDAAGFTQKAPSKQANQDRVLIQDCLLESGVTCAPKMAACRCFVADGIGGTRAAEIASAFVLEQIRERLVVPPPDGGAGLRALFEAINADLIARTAPDPATSGAGTTLVGLLHWQDGFRIVNAGDSEAWMMREDRFFRLSERQSLRDMQDDSPVTSYFGGPESELDLCMDTSLREVLPGDIVLLCSDGLFKALAVDQVRAVLRNSRNLAEKAEFLCASVAKQDAPDDTSCILVQAVA